PRIRNRPVYPNLPGDNKADRAKVTDSGGKIGCSKFYQTYGKKDLTGGILAAWCPHGVCYGFHCIPKGEGRNDVFSALLSYWRRPPKVIVYDFACALAPYCMLREPVFYGETLFVIDGFHGKGHTRCSPACFISLYKEWSSKLGKVNSSAGECGNSSLRKIRRAVSYMTQMHAISMIYIFLSVWNHMRRQQAEKEARRIAVDRSRNRARCSEAMSKVTGKSSGKRKGSKSKSSSSKK
ncbi:hypothetical protein AURDEDRAFT_75929, partial [Auricularia subglabra TFB-10046 SS5]